MVSDGGGIRRQSTDDFQSSENTLHDNIMMGMTGINRVVIQVVAEVPVRDYREGNLGNDGRRL